MLRVLAACAAALISFLIGFSAMGVHDTQSMAGAKSALVITRVTDNARALSILRSEASALRANFYRVRVDPSGRSPTRTLAAIVGDREEHDRVFPSGRYVQFDRTMTTTLVPVRGELIGTYFTTIPPGELHSVASRLTRAGAEARDESLAWSGLALYMLADTPIVLAGAVVVCAAWLCGFAHGFSRARERSATALLGVRCQVEREIGGALALAGACFAGTTAVAAVVLRGYNADNQFRPYVGLSAVLFTVVMVAFVAGLGTSARLPRRSRFRAAFSGWRPWGRGRLAQGATQVLTLTLVVFLVAEAVTAAGSLISVRGSGPAWTSCARCTTTIFNGFGGPAAFDAAVRPYASAVRAEESRGGVVLSWARGSTRGSVFTPGSSAANVIIANEDFIERSAGRLPDPLRGHRGPGEWGLIIPSDHATDSGAVAAEWRESLAHPLGRIADRAAPRSPHVSTYTPGRVFNYGQTDFRDDVYSESPLIVVIPAGSGLLDDESYFAAGSAGDLLFTGDLEHTRRVLDEAGVAPSTYALDSLSVQIDRGLSAARATLAVASVGAVAGLASLAGLLLISAQAAIARHRDRFFHFRQLGYPPGRLFSPMLVRLIVPIGATSALLPVAAMSGFVDGGLAPEMVAITALAVFATAIVTDLLLTIRLTTFQELRGHV
jgi:hypothetical protein